jgi:hypothetical protein
MTRTDAQSEPLGDAYPRAIALGRFNAGDEGTATYELFKPKGETGDNNTFTRLGGIAPIATGDMGYVVVFTTERGSETAERLNGTRDVVTLGTSALLVTADGAAKKLTLSLISADLSVQVVEIP